MAGRSNATTVRIVDADIHVAAPRVTELLPYLDEHWTSYIGENGFQQSVAVEYTYPSWSPRLATKLTDTTLEQIRRSVLLNGSSHAILTCYAGVDSIRHPDFSAALATAVNEWVKAEFLDQDQRLFASIVVTPQHPRLAAKEIERVAVDPRYVQVLLPARSWEPYGHQKYEPIWEAAAKHHLPLAVHYGGLTGTPSSAGGYMETYLQDYGAATQLFQGQIASLVASGAFSVYPDLCVVLMESGWTWMPGFFWRLEKEWKSMRREVPWVTKLPSEYVRQHFRATIQPLDAPRNQKQLREVLNHLGSDEMLLFASDFPHDHESDAQPLLDILSREQSERLLWKNAWETYGLEGRLGRLADAPRGRVKTGKKRPIVEAELTLPADE